MIIQISIKLPDGQEDALIQEFAEYHGWTAKIPDPKDETKEIVNPVTAPQYAKQKVAEFIKNSIRSKRANEAAEISRKAKIAEVDALEVS